MEITLKTFIIICPFLFLAGLIDQTTPNMIQDISSIIARKPMIIRKI